METQENIKNIFKHRYPFKLKEEWENESRGMQKVEDYEGYGTKKK